MSEMDFVIASCFEEEGKFEKAYEGFKTLEGIYPYPNLLRMKLDGIENRLKKKRDKNKKSPYHIKSTGWMLPESGLMESQLHLQFG